MKRLALLSLLLAALPADATPPPPAAPVEEKICSASHIFVATVVTPAGWRPKSKLVFRFGGGLFGIDELRKDLLGGPRYYFVVPSGEPRSLVFRSSYPWFLGAPDTPEASKLVEEALRGCKAPNKSSKPTPLRGAA